MKIIFLSLILSVLFVVACSSPQASLKKGKYKQAYKSALQKMKTKKATGSDSIVLSRALEMLIQKELPAFWNSKNGAYIYQ